MSWTTRAFSPAAAIRFAEASEISAEKLPQFAAQFGEFFHDIKAETTRAGPQF